MSTETRRQYAILLIKAEAARAVGDIEDYHVYQDQAEQLTRNTR